MDFGDESHEDDGQESNTSLDWDDEPLGPFDGNGGQGEADPFAAVSPTQLALFLEEPSTDEEEGERGEVMPATLSRKRPAMADEDEPQPKKSKAFSG